MRECSDSQKAQNPDRVDDWIHKTNQRILLINEQSDAKSGHTCTSKVIIITATAQGTANSRVVIGIELMQPPSAIQTLCKALPTSLCCLRPEVLTTFNGSAILTWNTNHSNQIWLKALMSGSPELFSHDASERWRIWEVSPLWSPTPAQSLNDKGWNALNQDFSCANLAWARNLMRNLREMTLIDVCIHTNELPQSPQPGGWVSSIKISSNQRRGYVLSIKTFDHPTESMCLKPQEVHIEELADQGLIRRPPLSWFWDVLP